MAKTVTLANMRTYCRDRYEIDDNYITDSMLNTWVNGSYYSLYNLMVEHDPHWFLTSSDLNIVSGTATVALPATCFKVRRVDILESGSDWTTLQRYSLAEENEYSGQSVQDRAVTRYLVAGDNIRLNPTPGWSQSSGLRVYYTPVPTTLSGDSSTLDGVSGWEEWIICDVGIKFFVKQEWQPEAIMAQRTAVENQIKGLASQRDTGNPPRMRNVYRERTRDYYSRYWQGR